MSGNIHGLCWFPQFPEKFLTYGQEINIYEIRPKEDNTTYKSRLPNISVNLLATERHYQFARCVQPSYHKDRPIIAVGMGDGKVGICNFHDSIDNSCEYTPRQQRMCTCLAWNEQDANILAIGHDRHRSDSCITIWDTERGMPKDNDFYGISESANSLCWDKNQRVLIAGISQKQIKLFDLRQGNATCQSMQTKMVHGLGVAPNGHYLCSYLDSGIMLWDLRALDRALKHIQSSKNHLQISWCPTRSSLLSSLQRESPYITLYDVRGVDVETCREVYYVKKQLLPNQAAKYHGSGSVVGVSSGALNNKSYALSALSWHPCDFERALLLSEIGNIIDFRLPLTMLTTHSNRQKLPLLMQRPPLTATTTTATLNQNTRGGSNSVSNFEFASQFLPYNIDVLDQELLKHDLVDDTRHRALNDYGLKMDIKRFSLSHLNSYLKNVWLSLDSLYRDERLIGLKTILGIGLAHTSEALMASARIETHVLQWPDFMNNSNNLIHYRSEHRDMAIQLCGWGVNDQEFDRFIAKLMDNKEYSRAAMICVFHLKILRACDILSKASVDCDSNMFRITAIALSSFNAEHCSTIWHNQRLNSYTQIKDAHLRAIFFFLTADSDNFDAVLNDDEIPLSDRMAFACKYLSENKLSDYVKQLLQKSIEKGDLNGLLLTGESLEGISILQAYHDVSFDVQTVALICINYFYHEHWDNQRIQFWVSSYLGCLNSWGLWEKRAELEIKIENLRAGPKASRSIYLSCNFCGKSVSNVLQEDMRMRSASSNINKLSSCPSCRKPLPRCSLCLMHMGTTLTSTTASEPGHESLGWQSKPFSKWFSWCQSCRHGGHVEHIMQWFKQNSECPISSCNCRCFDIDSTKLNTVRNLS